MLFKLIKVTNQHYFYIFQYDLIFCFIPINLDFIPINSLMESLISFNRIIPKFVHLELEIH